LPYRRIVRVLRFLIKALMRIAPFSLRRTEMGSE
jgi:hypothetical protein